MSLSRNEPVPGMPYFLPLNSPAIGSEIVEHTIKVGGPRLKSFEPLNIRDVTFKNRLWVSPMCMYSAEDGHQTDFVSGSSTFGDYANDLLISIVVPQHIGGFAIRGVGAICLEAHAVLPEGRITPQDAGIWKDSQIEPLKRLVEFCHARTKIGIQLAHAGRKASTKAPWVAKAPAGPQSDVASEDDGGWPDNVYAPSAIPFQETYPQPIEASKEYIENLVQAFKDATERCKKIGFDFIEIHGAHGYLIHSFVSPLSNSRTDEYGGSFENRIRLSKLVSKEVRAIWDRPLFYRISASDWADGPERDQNSGEWVQWGLVQSVMLSKELETLGIDLIDTSSGGLWSKQKIEIKPGYQVHFAEVIRSETSLRVGAVGLLTTAEQIEDVLQEGQADVVFLARELLRNADFVIECAEKLGVVVKPANQYERAWTRMSSGINSKRSKYHKEVDTRSSTPS
ncbi:NADH:flavin oxidoreductase/12-oxophytodienoate reductase [Phaffia rhodozyma]|uniref:NADH:flavin oxidoreductase/12-oxophytodienoate reductase n=1 Tax=Phaffia rhodozyma TaxID=264483 RepID=A0A0F7SP09_PHARH|nr:NADH:flavin oxidoreductase/12-oxophytodienoate reductase [Phaffia rhodozyma]